MAAALIPYVHSLGNGSLRATRPLRSSSATKVATSGSPGLGRADPRRINRPRLLSATASMLSSCAVPNRRSQRWLPFRSNHREPPPRRTPPPTRTHRTLVSPPRRLPHHLRHRRQAAARHRASHRPPRRHLPLPLSLRSDAPQASGGSPGRRRDVSRCSGGEFGDVDVAVSWQVEVGEAFDGGAHGLDRAVVVTPVDRDLGADIGVGDLEASHGQELPVVE